jgi:hypothetical protein
MHPKGDAVIRAIPSAALAIVAGRQTSASACCLDEIPGRTEVRLLASIEPLDGTAYARELAAHALAALRDRFAATAGGPPAERLDAAVGAANAVLLADNRRPERGGERQLRAGVAAVAVAGRSLVAALVAPTQLVVVQDRRLYAIPALSSWGDGDDAADADEAPPLGETDWVQPTIVRTRAADGDLVVLCHSTLVRAAARHPATRALFTHVLVEANPTAVVTAAAEIARERAFDDTFVLAARLGKPALPVLPPRRARTAPSTVGNARRFGSAGVMPSAYPKLALATSGPTIVVASSGTDLARSLQLALVGALETLRPAPRPTTHGSLGPERRAPGVGSVRRYIGGAAEPSPLRSLLPRGLDARVRVPGRLLAAGALAAVVAVGTVGAAGVQRARGEQALAALAAVERATDVLAADPVAPMLAIADGERALTDAGAAGASATRLADVSAAFDAARDTALGIERFGDMTRVGSLPPTADPLRATLVTLDDRVFLAGGGFYEVDVDRGHLVELIAPGQLVDGAPVGVVIDAAVDQSGVLLSDGVALYRQGDGGAWRRQVLVEPRLAGGPNDGPSASFNRSLYALAAGGSIVKYEDDGRGLAPWMWASAGDYPDLADARDIAVDERVHVLLADGRVFSFSRGVLEASSALPVMPEASGNGFFASAPGSRALYVVDPTSRVGNVAGRLIRFDGGGRTQQFLAPMAVAGDGTGAAEAALAARVLANARSVAVVEAAGSVYLISGGDLWQATLPPLID